jgi:ribokinase
MPDLIIIGNCCADIYIPAHQAPPPGGIERIPQLRVEIGGNGANTAVTAARLGASTALAGVLGDDLFGRHLRQALESEGIDLSLLESREGTGAPVTLVLNDADGERSFVHHGGSNDAWEIPPAAIETPCRVFHMAAPEILGSFWGAPCLDTAHSLKKAGVQLSLDFFVPPDGLQKVECRDTHGPLLEIADMVFPNELEARAITGQDTVEDMLASLHDSGVSLAVIKRGAKGAVVSWDGNREDISAAGVSAIDTCGAGDNFAGAFLAGWLKELDPVECARLGCEMGTLCVQQKGAVTASSNAAKLEDLIERFRIG